MNTRIVELESAEPTPADLAAHLWEGHMVWSWKRRGQTAMLPKLPQPGVCRQGRHTLRTEHLMFYSPQTMLDHAAAWAICSDFEAQRWLGWGTEHIIVNDEAREALCEVCPGDTDTSFPSGLPRRLMTDPFEPPAGPFERLIGVRLDDGRYAADLLLSTDTGEIGGVLARHARGLGLGAELFGAAALFAHTHFGFQTVKARHEVTNVASARTLERAGFVASDGPPRFTLPNGREISIRWMTHRAVDGASNCRVES
ncbi:GNAT family N-acetyltransferase [Streptomyces sp. Tue6028]|uniref:GNAT family N-acetyltransferase n=1 Tax=Streptomyces sp. Tue6028 TaxID=2036037 RepID=UPI003D715753